MHLSSVNDPINSHPMTHDDFFVRSMSDLRIAKAFFQQYLPEDLSAAIDLDQIEICKDKFHAVDLKSKITDMLYCAPFKNFSGPVYISALVEHQSTPKKSMPLRILSYEAAIMQRHWEQYKVAPLVYTIVYYNGQARWNYSRDIKDLIQAPVDLIARYALQPFQLIELNRIDDQELRRSLWAGVMSLAMKHIFDQDILPALRSFIGLLKILESQHAGAEYVSSLLYYLYKRGEIQDENQFHELISIELPPYHGEATMTLAELHTRRGIEQGLQQGLQQGFQNGVQNKSREIAQNLLREGVDPMLVAKATGLDIHTIQEIMAELQV
ncbi:MAG: Rpn family recombination-promoting nuclease/putative transposase [Proteobacteria bacterium]|nr:Rpn family recombination-promoting nuclease/putative transposase [Pseudomonadota bacterium]